MMPDNRKFKPEFKSVAIIHDFSCSVLLKDLSHFSIIVFVLYFIILSFWVFYNGLSVSASLTDKGCSTITFNAGPVETSSASLTDIPLQNSISSFCVCNMPTDSFSNKTTHKTCETTNNGTDNSQFYLNIYHNNSSIICSLPNNYRGYGVESQSQLQTIN